MRPTQLARWIGALATCFAVAPGAAGDGPDLDRKVQAFLSAERGKWDYLNMPYQDGQILHDLVVKGGHRRILEIGTSTGHSTVWLAWQRRRPAARSRPSRSTWAGTSARSPTSSGPAWPSMSMRGSATRTTS